jgi:hypothetical protein
VTDEEQQWLQWLQRLSDDDRRRAEQMLQALREMGCQGADAYLWARSELGENIAQLARYRFLHQMWPRFIDAWRDRIDHLPATDRAIAAGAQREDLSQLARAVAYETVQDLLYYLDDDGLDRPLADQLPYWKLMELDPTGAPTGRQVGGLFESLLGLDPSDLAGDDLWT